MIKRILLLPVLCTVACGLQAVTSDLLPPTRRKVVVDDAVALSTPQVLLPLPSTIPSPFNPVGYGQPDAEELEAMRKAQQKAQVAQSGPIAVSDKDLLARISQRLNPSGSTVFNGENYLMFPGKRLRKGDMFVVSYEGRDFELEITDIQRTTFSLRYNTSEITRSIKPGKNQ